MDIRKLIKLSLFVSIACVLQIMETTFIPCFVPGLKIGLPNIITIIVLYKYSLKEAVSVAALRTIVASLLMGTIFSPAFFLSFSGSVTSSIIMGCMISSLYLRAIFTIIGVSVAGSLVHTLTQFVIAYYILLRSPFFIYSLPFLLIGSVISGILTGYVGKKTITALSINSPDVI